MRTRPSRDETRARLFAAAADVFVRVGIGAATVEEVATAADLTRGAVYSNFRNKDELCIAVLDEVRAERLAEILDIMAKPDTSLRVEALQVWAERVVGDPAWTSLEVEFAAHARHNEPLRHDLASRLTTILQILTGATESADAAKPQLAGGETAIVMLALGVGLGLLRSIDPSIPVDGLVDVLRLVSDQT